MVSLNFRLCLSWNYLGSLSEGLSRAELPIGIPERNVLIVLRWEVLPIVPVPGIA